MRIIMHFIVIVLSKMLRRMPQVYSFSTHTHTQHSHTLKTSAKLCRTCAFESVFFGEREIHEPIKNVERMLPRV